MTLRLVDTHCHIHEADYPLRADEVLERAAEAGVDRVICIGTDENSSVRAVDFANSHENVWAIIGVHPHESKFGIAAIPTLATENSKNPKLVGIGEIGLDYFYHHSPRDDQIKALNEQIELAIKYDLPISFHVRNAFDDFWPIFDNFHGVRGVLHSYTDSVENMEEGLVRGLYFGVNGIVTFNKDPDQHRMYQSLPIDRILLETDAPFLTPAPNRGKVNESAFVRDIAGCLGKLYDQTIEQIAETTTQNAQKLFSLK